MVQIMGPDQQFSSPNRQPLFSTCGQPVADFPIQTVDIKWELLKANRPVVLEKIDKMPAYLLKDEVLNIIAAEPDPSVSLLLDIMWSTGANVSEALALTPASFSADDFNIGVTLETPKQGPGRPSKKALQRSSKRYIPIKDPHLQQRINAHLWMGKFHKDQRIFPMCRQTVHRRIQKLVERVGGAPFRISCKTFRHSFAIHLLLHGRPLKYVSQLLGHRSVDATEIYTNVLTTDGVHFMDGVDFH